MNPECINHLAQATGDFQWIHLDQEMAEAESAYGKPIVYEFLTLSLVHYFTGMVNADKPPILRAQRLINYGFDIVHFFSPVTLGKHIREHV